MGPASMLFKSRGPNEQRGLVNGLKETGHGPIRSNSLTGPSRPKIETVPIVMRWWQQKKSAAMLLDSLFILTTGGRKTQTENRTKRVHWLTSNSVHTNGVRCTQHHLKYVQRSVL